MKGHIRSDEMDRRAAVGADSVDDDCPAACENAPRGQKTQVLGCLLEMGKYDAPQGMFEQVEQAELERARADPIPSRTGSRSTSPSASSVLSIRETLLGSIRSALLISLTLFLSPPSASKKERIREKSLSVLYRRSVSSILDRLYNDPSVIVNSAISINY